VTNVNVRKRVVSTQAAIGNKVLLHKTLDGVSHLFGRYSITRQISSHAFDMERLRSPADFLVVIRAAVPAIHPHGSPNFIANHLANPGKVARSGWVYWWTITKVPVAFAEKLLRREVGRVTVTHFASPSSS
jgi:hypothetical protein